ncbi:hypothetical protein ACFY0F_13215 [Streptomyces sp. NPDC001544]|uniref:hypothetical protein n=1 Tax=Streptomyces sp. NPDC001544 TaxID=3364584 RepID=UPI0036C50C88
MTRRVRAVQAILLSFVVATMGFLAAPSASASAGTYCQPGFQEYAHQSRTINLPNKPDVVVTVSTCLYNEKGFYQAVQVLKWHSTIGTDCCGTKFNWFEHTTWVQKNDVNKCSESTHPDINSYESGSSTITCVWNSADTTGMSADGKVAYDIADDGKDPITWNLTGTG